MVELTLLDGSPVYINPRNVAYIYNTTDETQVVIAFIGSEANVRVAHTLDNVAALIDEALK